MKRRPFGQSVLTDAASRRGLAVVELAAILPVLTLTIFAAVSLAVFLHRVIAADAAAREAAQFGSVRPLATGDEAAFIADVREAALLRLEEKLSNVSAEVQVELLEPDEHDLPVPMVVVTVTPQFPPFFLDVVMNWTNTSPGPRRTAMPVMRDER